MIPNGTSRLNITPNVDNEFIFNILETGMLVPMVIHPTDTFFVKLIKLSDNTTVDLTKECFVVDATKGKIGVIITASEANNLLSLIGPSIDRYYLKHVYRLIIEANTVVNNFFIAEVRKVSVG